MTKDSPARDSEDDNGGGLNALDAPQGVDEGRAGVEGATSHDTLPSNSANPVSDPFADLPRGHFGAIYADPPWRFETWGDQTNSAHAVERHYSTMGRDEIRALPVESLAADDCVLFLWVTWPTLDQALDLITAWGFNYKTCAFAWMKANGRQPDMFAESVRVEIGTGYWTRSNSEVCLLATRGKPKRLNADVRQGIIEPRREHSRKPDCVPKRIERLVEGPYLELFARTEREGWASWGNEVGKFEAGA